MICWGCNVDGQTDIPEVLRAGAVALAAGTKNTCGVDVRGHMVCFGIDKWGITDVPYDMTEHATVFSIGIAHVIGLDLDGYAHCWGRNIGQCEI